MTPVWDGKMRDLYARELREVGMDREGPPGDRWSFAPAKAPRLPKLPKGPPPIGTFEVTVGPPETPFNSMNVKGSILRMRSASPGHQVLHVRLYGRRLRIVVTPAGNWIDFSGKEVSWFPRRRSTRMAGK